MITPIHSAGDALLTAFGNALGTLFSFIPRLIGTVLILLIGIFAGRLVGRIVTRGLRALRFDEIAERAEIGTFLRDAGVRLDPAATMGLLAEWFVYLIFFQAAASTLGFPQVTQILNQIVAFIPRIVLAILILLLGALAANVLSRLVRGSLSAARFGDASGLATVTRWGVLVFAIVAALSQLEIAPAIVNTLWTALIGGTALALALAFGLGARDAMGSLAAGRLIKSDLSPGTALSVDGQEGTVERIGAIFTTLRVGALLIQVPNVELTRRSLSAGGSRALVGPDGRPLTPGDSGAPSAAELSRQTEATAANGRTL